MITDAYIVHHSHTDIGYTDLPSTVWELQVAYLRQAMRYAEETRDYPPEARFAWTCEAMAIVERFLKTASRDERARFRALVKEGRFEVCAMPWNLQPHLDGAEWRVLMERFAPLFRSYHPRTAMQNDINGFPWGATPALHQAGVRYAWLAINVYSGGTPLPQAPRAFWWEIPGGGKLLAWQGESYPVGYFFFHEQEWRKGPVPPVHDVWFNPPGKDDIFARGRPALAAAHAQFHKRMERYQDYPYQIIPLEVTNMWRIDNDPPCRMLSDFVRAWNAAKFQPRLHFVTAGTFLAELERRHGSQLPTLRGDWPDWWADGAASLPLELALNQRSKRLLADLPGAAKALGVRLEAETSGKNPKDNPVTLTSPSAPADGIAGLARRAWADAALFDEHTWGAYDSVARPTSPRALGCLAQKANLAYRAHENALRARAELLRAARLYRPLSATRRVAVVNPGGEPRSGWVHLSARPFRFAANALRDLATGEVLPLETVLGAEWSGKLGDDLSGTTPFDVPNDVWAYMPQVFRAFVRDLAPGKKRLFELIEQKAPPPPAAVLEGENADFAWSFHAASGLPAKLVDVASGTDLVDRIAPWGFGQVVVERVPARGAREVLATHDPAKVKPLLKRSVGKLVAFSAEPSACSARFKAAYEHEAFHRLEQVWDLLPGRRMALTTTVWLREYHGPQAMYLALPLALSTPRTFYHSLDVRTQVGADQIPNTCGEYLPVNAGVEYETEDLLVSVATPDAPLACFDALHTRDGQRAFVPQSGHLYSILLNTYWLTNFSHTRPGKVVFEHVIQCGGGLRSAGGDLWAFPAR